MGRGTEEKSTARSPSFGKLKQVMEFRLPLAVTVTKYACLSKGTHQQANAGLPSHKIASLDPHLAIGAPPSLGGVEHKNLSGEGVREVKTKKVPLKPLKPLTEQTTFTPLVALSKIDHGLRSIRA